MNIPLDEFEQIIDESILKRGLAYFERDLVTDFSEISRGEYEAIVSGTEDYSIQLVIKNTTITEHNCDCPFEGGPVCKHVVAVIFYLLQEELDLNQITTKSPRKPKSKSLNKEIKDLLKSVSNKELMDFVVEYSKSDKKLSNYFLATFGYLSQNQSKEFYQKQIQSIVKTAKGRDGWIYRSDMNYLVKSIKPFLDNAAKYLQHQNFENIFYLSTSLIEEMIKANKYTQDENGDLDYIVGFAIELLSKLTKEKTSETLKNEIFEYCITSFNQRSSENWGWYLNILRIADNLVENGRDVNMIISLLDNGYGDYELSCVQAYKLELLNKYKDTKEIELFINAQISNPVFRQQELEKAFGNKNYDKAIELAKDGIICDKEKKPGLVIDWYEWLLKIAMAQNDKINIIQYARYGFIKSFRPKQDHYQILKNTIEPEKWHPFLEEIIQEITPLKGWTYDLIIRKIYIKEEWWDRLFLKLKQNLYFEMIEEYEQYLAKDYASELIEFYNELIREYVDFYLGREHYQKACKYIIRMKNLGGNEQANDLIQLFKKQYPQRRALMEELKKIG